MSKPTQYERKRIAGSWYIRCPCLWCKELVWFVDKRQIGGSLYRVCETCSESNLHPATRGGKQVIRKVMEQG